MGACEEYEFNGHGLTVGEIQLVSFGLERECYDQYAPFIHSGKTEPVGLIELILLLLPLEFDEASPASFDGLSRAQLASHKARLHTHDRVRERE